MGVQKNRNRFLNGKIGFAKNKHKRSDLHRTYYALNRTGAGRKKHPKSIFWKFSDIDALTEDILTDCKASAARVIEAILAEMKLQIREDKHAYKEQDLVMKEKDHHRSLLTKAGHSSYYRRLLL